MPNQTKIYELKNRASAGFSLIELMISLAVFLIFISSVYGLLRVANIQKGTVNSQTEVTKNLRLSLNTIGRDAVNAGLGYSRVGGNMPDNLSNVRMGVPTDADAAPDLLTAVIAGNDINTNAFLPTAGRTDVISFAFQDKSFNGGATIPITDSAVFGTTGVTLTSAGNGAANVRQYDLLFVTENARTAMALVTTKANDETLRLEVGVGSDPLGINAPFNGTADSKSRLTKCTAADIAANRVNCMNFTGTGVTAKKIIWVSYSVLNDGTLMRTTYGNNTGGTLAQQIQTQPIAYNVENFQCRYLLRDGTFTDDPSANGTNQTALNRVVQVQITLSSRITVQENGVNLQRVVDLKSTFSTRNLSYDAS